MLKLVKYSNLRNISVTRLCTAFSSTSSSSSVESQTQTTGQNQHHHPSRPVTLKDAKLTNVIESKEEFEKYVKRILPSQFIPEPPKHDSYPTPSGWVPPNYEKCGKLPYYVLRTRFHQFPIYPEERDGSKRYVRIKNVEGDIWVRCFSSLFILHRLIYNLIFFKQFERDLRKHIEESIKKHENKSENVYAQVNEIQRHVLVKGYYQEYINDFFLKCGF